MIELRWLKKWNASKSCKGHVLQFRQKIGDGFSIKIDGVEQSHTPWQDVPVVEEGK